ncbi:MAG: metallophosphoesterase [Armatimonadota bacterium]
MITPVDLHLAALPAEFDGLTVAAISDVHAEVRLGGARGVRALVEQVNAARPDLIVLLGDIVHHPRNAHRVLPLLEGLQAREGVWACLGNHEHGFVWFSRYFGRWPGPSVEEWRELYRRIGAELLVNEARPLPRGGARIWLLGVDDAYSGRDDLRAALAQADAAEFCLAATHHPDLVERAQIGAVDLLLAGHTHGGQVHIPVLGPVHVSCHKPRQRAMGLVRANGTLMYVTRGAGEGFPLRVGCPREIPLIRLCRPPQEEGPGGAA